MGETGTGLAQYFVYDRYGNRTVNNAASNFPGLYNLPFTASTANNRLQSSGSCMVYDAVGNLTNDCGKTRAYDGNNKMVSAFDSGVTTGYRYNADGQRTVKTVGSVNTWYIYGMGGELIAEYPANGATSTPQMEYGYRNGQMLIEGGCDVVRWLVADHLGTPRMSVDITGTLTNLKRHDYLPFGEEIGAGIGIRTTGQGYSGDCIRQKFTGYERDTETGLDYAQARYFANVQGRFTSVDPSQRSISLINPQSFNRYAYALNNPLAYIDHNGKWPTAIHGLIIDRAFRGLSGFQKDVLKRASGDVDGIINGGQSQKLSYQHGMRAPNQSVKKAAGLAADFIKTNQFTARNEYNLDNMVRHTPGFSEKSLQAFGNALHTVTDMTSPAHEGFQIWNGLPIPGTSAGLSDAYMAIAHSSVEEQISPGRLGFAIGASLKLFEDTYGAKAFKQATDGVIFGSANDPSVQEIRAQYSLPGSNPKSEAEALNDYRLGLQRGLNFNWNQQ